MGLIVDEVFKNQYGYTFDDLIDGYKRSLKLIKKIDRNAYNKIMEIAKFYQATQPDKYNQLANALKEHFLDDDIIEKGVNLWESRLHTEIDARKLKLLTSSSVSSIEIDSWDMLEVSQTTAYPLQLGERATSYTIAPIFYDYKSMEAGYNNGVPFFEKNIEHDILGSMINIEKEYEYVLYKDVSTFKIHRTDLHNKHVEKDLNIEL